MVHTNNISLITMGQGNMKALKKTLDSFHGIVNEVIYGDLLIFDEDREVLQTYIDKYNVKVVSLPFNYIFLNGFSNTLNTLISYASNDFVLYMNTGEVIDQNYGINEIIDSRGDCDAFYFNHRVEFHKWYRCFNKNTVRWEGLIHEEPIGIKRPFIAPIFMMKDEEKDMCNPFKASVFNSVKEMVYWQQLIRIVDNPQDKGITNDFWVNFAKEQYQSMKDRLIEKGNQYTAFLNSNFDMFLHEINNSDYFAKEKFESNDLINFQGNRKIVL